MEEDSTCHGCAHLQFEAFPDGSGDASYLCSKFGFVVGLHIEGKGGRRRKKMRFESERARDAAWPYMNSPQEKPYEPLVVTRTVRVAKTPEPVEYDCKEYPEEYEERRKEENSI